MGEQENRSPGRVGIVVGPRIVLACVRGAGAPVLRIDAAPDRGEVRYVERARRADRG